MKLFDKQSLALLVSVVTINVLCIIAVSYAYFTTQIKGNDTAQPITVVMGSMKIKYEDSDLVTLDNAIPGDYLINKFKITNTGTLDATYNLKIDVVENNFRDKGDLEYTLRRNGEPIVENEILPYTDGYILTNVTIPKEEVHNYELEVKFKVDEEDKNQNDNKNRRVDFKIVVDSNEDAQEYVYAPLYKDNSGANIPELYQGMIPIKYEDINKDGTKEIVIADVTEKWYDYDEHEWANAVLIDHTNKDIVNKFYKEDGTLRKGDIVTTGDILQMYVWIPRYKYQLFNVNNEGVKKQLINIAFETGEDNTGTVSCEYINQHNGTIEERCTNAENGEWYTHPGFTFGDTELSGIWVGKFESSDPDNPNGFVNDSISEITILPNKTSMVNKKISIEFDASRKIEGLKTKYGINSGEIDTHLMENMEWGAVAYLTQSIYGIYKNENTCGIDEMSIDDCMVWKNNIAQYKSEGAVYPGVGGTATGCVGNIANASSEVTAEDVNSSAICPEGRKWDQSGIKASTTGNMYGIYDMSGGAWEQMMDVMVDSSGEAVLANSGFEYLPDSKYFNLYSYSDSITSFNRSYLGDSIREILKNTNSLESAWNGGCTEMIYKTTSWIIKGGMQSDMRAGIFSFGYNLGINRVTSFRVVLTAQDGVD